MIRFFLLCSFSGVAPSLLLAQSLAERFDRMDRDSDGKVTAQELPRPELFARLDRNRDGVIERSEIRGADNPQRSRGPSPGLTMPGEPPHTPHLNISYAEVDGVDPNLLSLDLYAPKPKGGSTKARPVMMMIHGGGWRGGDKANPAIVGAKMHHFVGAGYLYASINYRLSPPTPQENGLIHPVHAQDCAKAIAWIHNHIADYGGDPDQLHLMGHSAGGHLAAILGTNERFLNAEGKELSILKSNVLLDPAAIDIPRYLELVQGRGMTQLYQLAFGTEPENHRDASPQHHIGPDKGIPPTLVFYAAERMNLNDLAPDFAQSLTEAGSPSQAVDMVTLDHGQINSHIGRGGDPMTQLIMRLHAGENPTSFPGRIEAPSPSD